ncbi:hypothetical protein LINPERHAP1_LOCUS20864 [Linum perenne]
MAAPKSLRFWTWRSTGLQDLHTTICSILC